MAHDPNSGRPVAEREVREHTHTHTSEKRGGSGMAVIIAAVILVVAGLAYVMFSGDGTISDGVEVNVESSAPAGDGGSDPEAAPAADSAAPADASGGGETAPAAAD